MASFGLCRWTGLSGSSHLIFLTVGTHEPFDRLVRSVDLWATSSGKHIQVFGQITDRATYKPGAFEWTEKLKPEEFRKYCKTAQLIVSHAGMGTLITALTYGTEVVVLPRRAKLGETRNDHQLATARHLRAKSGVHVADNEQMLPSLLDEILSVQGTQTRALLAPFAEQDLIEALQKFLGTR